jgi:hypothetical protein
MAREWKPHRAEQSFVGELKKGACGESVASHVRVTAAPSFCERRFEDYRRTKGEMSRAPFLTDGVGIAGGKNDHLSAKRHEHLRRYIDIFALLKTRYLLEDDAK